MQVLGELKHVPCSEALEAITRRAEIRTNTQAMDELREQVREADADLKGALSREGNLKVKQIDLEMQLTTARQAVENLRSKHEGRGAEGASLAAKDQVIAERDDKVRELEGLVHSKEEEVRRLTQAAQDEKDKRERYRNQRKETEARNTALSDEVDSLRSQLVQMTKERDAAKAVSLKSAGGKTDDLWSQLTKEQAARRSAEKERDERAAALDKAESTARDETDRADILLGQLEEERAALKRAEETSKARAGQVADLEDQLREAREEMKRLQDQKKTLVDHAALRKKDLADANAALALQGGSVRNIAQQLKGLSSQPTSPQATPGPSRALRDRSGSPPKRIVIYTPSQEGSRLNTHRRFSSSSEEDEGGHVVEDVPDEEDIVEGPHRDAELEFSSQSPEPAPAGDPNVSLDSSCPDFSFLAVSFAPASLRRLEARALCNCN